MRNERFTQTCGMNGYTDEWTGRQPYRQTDGRTAKHGKYFTITDENVLICGGCKKNLPTNFSKLCWTFKTKFEFKLVESSQTHSDSQTGKSNLIKFDLPDRTG